MGPKNLLKSDNSSQKLSDVAYSEMLVLIREGTWAMNSRLPSEHEMARQFRLSRPVIRQALARLRQEGLITSRRGSGSYLTRSPGAEKQFPSITSIADLELIVSFREGIEGEAAALAAQRRSKEQLESLRALANIPDNPNSEENANRDFEFHVGVADASGNPFFAKTLLSLRSQVKLCMNLTWSISAFSVDFNETLNKQHTDILAAIESQDAERARVSMRHHVRWAHQRFMHGRPDERI